MSFLGYPKIILCTKFEHFGIIRRLVVLESGLGLESGLESIFAGLGLGLGLELKGLGLGLGLATYGL